MTVKSSLLYDAIEDAIMSIAEANEVCPTTINIHYPKDEFEVIEKFHRFRVKADGTKGLTAERWPVIRLKVLGIDVNIHPEPEQKDTLQGLPFALPPFLPPPRSLFSLLLLSSPLPPP
jgi:hypothetical protein